MWAATTSASTRPTTRSCSFRKTASGAFRRQRRSGSRRRSSTRWQRAWRERMDEAVGSERVDSAAAESVQKIVDNLGQVVHAPEDTLRLSVLCLVAEGHLIIEDFPGVGKTMLAKALARP